MKAAQYVIDIGTSGDHQAVRRLDAVQGKLRSVDRAAGLTSRALRGLGDAFRTLPGAEFFTNPIVAMTAGLGVVTRLGMEAEKTATAFNVLVGNESKAAKMLGFRAETTLDQILDEVIPWIEEQIRLGGI